MASGTGLSPSGSPVGPEPGHHLPFFPEVGGPGVRERLEAAQMPAQARSRVWGARCLWGPAPVPEKGEEAGLLRGEADL